MKLDFDKNDGLLPAVIQDAKTNKVLMLGYMNREALSKTEQEGRVTFYSRSRQELWTKGETSGNFLNVKSILADCDQDTILIKAEPEGPVCHTGQDTCFKELNQPDVSFLVELEQIIAERKRNPEPESYTARLFSEGINKIAQKVGEEATEVVIDAVANNDERLKEETADLLYHLLVLLAEKNIGLNQIGEVLMKRHKK